MEETAMTEGGGEKRESKVVCEGRMQLAARADTGGGGWGVDALAGL